MSENLSILDGELRRQFAPVDRLSVDNQGGGVSPWVISDFLDISTLSVSENGLYLAAEEEYDCYEEVEVDISEELGEGDYRRITGKGQDGNDYAVSVDGDGNLTTEMIPAAIHIVVPPRKLKYEEGETIDFDGIHVYLMDGNNKRYVDESYPTGEIPFSELVFPITIASGSSGSDISYTTIDPETAEQYKEYADQVNFPIQSSSNTKWISANWDNNETGEHLFTTSLSDNSVVIYACSIEPSTVIDQYKPASYGEYSERTIPVDTHASFNGKSFYCNSVIKAYSQPGLEYTGPDVVTGDANFIAYCILFGETRSGGGDEIPVQWIRSDGEILEDSFTIEIGKGGDPEPEPEPDPWAGYADVSWGGHHYNLNRRIVPEVHYANGYLWQEGISIEYNVEQAASMGWLILIR